MTATATKNLEDMTKAELVEKLQEKAAAPPITFKVSEAKKALSVYGLGRFPVTLYAGQWERLMENMTGLAAFIVEHPELARKE